MALFSRKTNTKTKAPAETKALAQTSVAKGVSKDRVQGVILRPRITEKATTLAEKQNVYVFEVHPKSTKSLVEKTIRATYNVTPVKVTMVTNPAKRVIVRNTRGVKGGVKKAYVFLKKGEKIEFA